MIYIGIDPGKHCGIATWNRDTRRLLELDTYEFWSVIAMIEANKHRAFTRYIIERPSTNKPSWHKTGNRFVDDRISQNIGANKLYAELIIEYMERSCVSFEAVPPIRHGFAKQWKKDSVLFKKHTGYVGRTSEHSRDAAGLVYGR